MKHKRILTLIITLVLLLSLLIQPILAAFEDVPEGSWFEASVQYAIDHGLFYGITDTEFGPDTTMTRGMFATVLYRMARATDTDTYSGFTDVPEEMYYARTITWAAKNSLVYGITDTEFWPESPVTREQICALLLRFCDYLEFELPEKKEPIEFIDAEDISAYAVSAVSLCQQAGLVYGYDDNTFLPQNSATRAEVSAFVRRLGLLLEEAGYEVGPGPKPEPEPEPEPDWRLILVNPTHSVPEGYIDSLELISLNGKTHIAAANVPSTQAACRSYIDARIYDDYAAMMAAMRSAGLSPYINSAFRTNAYQQYLYNNKVSQYISYGYSRARAEVLAAQWVAVPGTSEHELGLALDISMNASNSAAVYSWLAKNAWKYGFTYRYQSDKVSITGIQPEAWHYRYVGYEHAKAMYESGMCLEEYVEYLYG